MLQLLHLLVPTAHAQTTTSSFTTYMIGQFYSLFWTPFGAWAVFAIVIAIVVMVVRRLRGQGRRPG